MERGCFQVQAQHTGVDLHEVEEVVDEPAEVYELPAGRGEIAFFGLLVRDDTIGYCFDEGEYGRERRTQVVGDGGDQVAAGLLYLALDDLRFPRTSTVLSITSLRIFTEDTFTRIRRRAY